MLNQEVILKWLHALSISLIALFAPIHSLLMTTGAIIIIDMLSGVLAARKQGLPITSSGLRRSISKFFVYELALMIAFLAETYMSDLLPLVKMASAMITLVEVTSVYENLNIIGGNNLLKSLIDRLGSNNQDVK